MKASDLYSPDSSVNEVDRIIIWSLENNENNMFPVFPQERDKSSDTPVMPDSGPHVARNFAGRNVFYPKRVKKSNNKSEPDGQTLLNSHHNYIFGPNFFVLL